MQTQCRYAQSLGGGFSGNPNDVWGTVPYKSRKLPAVFCGMYDLRDYIALWRHKGKAWIFWCGSDIRNLVNGFVLNDGKLRWLSWMLGNWWIKWILKKAEHWVENEWEYDQLLTLGIKSKICPSFFGKINKPITYQHSEKPHVYLSSSPNRQKEYGFDIIEKIAPMCPDITFHLYGASWLTKQPNVIPHGRVPLEQMDRETEKMQCSLRLNATDGFSEITAKAILRGQYAITRIPHPFIPHFENLMQLVSMLNSLRQSHEPCVSRVWYMNNLNKFPWCL